MLATLASAPRARLSIRTSSKQKLIAKFWTGPRWLTMKRKYQGRAPEGGKANAKCKEAQRSQLPGVQNLKKENTGHFRKQNSDGFKRIHPPLRCSICKSRNANHEKEGQPPKGQTATIRFFVYPGIFEQLSIAELDAQAWPLGPQFWSHGNRR